MSVATFLKSVATLQQQTKKRGVKEMTNINTLKQAEIVDSVTVSQYSIVQRKHESILKTYKRLEETRKHTSSRKVALIHDLNKGDKDIRELLKETLELIGIATHDMAFTNRTTTALDENY